MLFQQFSGICAVLFFDAKIFKTAGFTNGKAVSLAVAAAQVVATGIACLIVDKVWKEKSF